MRRPGADLRRVLRPRAWSLATQLFAIQALIVLVVLVGTGLAALSNAVTANEDAARDEVLGVARALAADPSVLAALDRPDPSTVLQPLAERVRRETATDFVVVMSPTGVRYSHPDPARIGQTFLGTIEPATRGGVVVEVFTGTLGPSVRAVVPVQDGGQVRGLVAVGRTVARVSEEMTRQLPILVGTTAVALLIAATGSWGASRWLRRTTHDLGPRELSRMYEYYDAVLHAVREGLLLLDRQGRIQLVNDEARRLLDLPADVLGQRVDEAGLPGALGAALADGGELTDEIFVTGERVVVVNQAGAHWDGQHLGTVVTLRDHTELRALAGELATIRGFADALGAQAHESANQLHTVVSLIELGRAEQALDFATRRLADTQQLTDLVLGGVGEPAVAALVLGKHAEAAERGVELQVAEDLDLPAGVADARDLVTIVGNLVDNAVDAAVAGDEPRWVRLDAYAAGDDVCLQVADSGRGVPDVDRVFDRGWSTKRAADRPQGRGLGLALVAQAVRRHGGTVTVANEGGAVFTVRLPGPARPPQPPAAPGTPGPPQHPAPTAPR